MPARVHALLVVRPDGRVAPDIHLRRTLASLAAQTRPVDTLTIVVCGDDRLVRDIVANSGAEGVIAAGRSTRFAEALKLASHRLDGDAVWLLAQDTAPEPGALAALTAALETAPSVAVAAPKLVRWDDRTHIVSLGVTMTRWGRTIGLADGEHDQGQHDAREDVLGSDVRGVLVRADAWRELNGIDPALAGADEGLDLGVRARLAGGRVALAPAAVVAVAGDGVAGDHDGDSVRSRSGAVYAARTAQLHRRLVYARGAWVIVHWLSLLPVMAGRTVGHLLAKRPGRIPPEIAATAVAGVRLPSVAARRATIRRTRRASWAQLAPLRIDGRDLRQRLDDDGPRGDVRSELRFFSSSGGAWIVLAALVVSLAAFPALLAWPVLGGGALAPLRATVEGLWADALAGARPLGWNTTGPADPFSGLIALLGTLSPAAPSRALVVLWLLALPLAALGGWFAATRLTEKPLPRALLAVGWALAPTFLTALTEGRPAAVIVHLVLPWLLLGAAGAHRSWTDAATASVALVVVLACAPSLTPAVVFLWLVAIVLAVATRPERSGRPPRSPGHGRPRGALARVIWLVVPAAVIGAPLIAHRWAGGDGWSLLADPGVATPFDALGGDVGDRLLLAAGFPTSSVAGWAGLLPEGWPVAAASVFVAPIFLLAVLAPLVARVLPATVLLLVAAAGLATALLTSGVALSATGSVPVALWPGSALSLMWAGLLGAGAATAAALPRARSVRAAAVTVALFALAVGAAAPLTALHRDAAVIANGPESTLPAYVDAEGRGDPGTATFILRPQPRGGIATEVVWGESATLGGQTTLQSARSTADAADRRTAAATADLVTGSAGDVVERLADHGIGYVLLATQERPTDAARATRLEAKAALDRRDDLESVGDTGKGELWLVVGDVVPRQPTATEQAQAWRIGAMQAGVVVVALLLALPTSASIRAARRQPRVIGGGDA